MELPPPECSLGYTRAQVEQILQTPARMLAFDAWMYGQTIGLCDGQRYNHDTKQYEPSCGPHGAAYYRVDLQRFLSGLPVID